MFYKTIDKHLKIIFKNNKHIKNELMFTTLFSRNNYYLEYFKNFNRKDLYISNFSLIQRKIFENYFKFKILIFFIIRIILIKVFIKKKNLNKEINFFKVFYNPNSKNDAKENKIYFNIRKNLKSRNTYYFPVIFNYSIRDIFKIIKKLKKKNYFIYWEHYIGLKDIIKIFIFNENFEVPNILYKNKNYKLFYKLNLNEISFLENYYLSKVYYLFFKKIKNTLNIKKFFAIWENQSIDKAIFKSIKKNFINCKSCGILVENFPISYISSYPTKLEILENFTPNNILVPGIRMKKIFKSLSSKLNIVDLTLFKYESLISKNNSQISNIFLILPIYLDECIFILKKIAKVIDKNKDVNIKIKFHPTINSNLFIKSNPEFSFLQKYFSQENISLSIKKSNKVILGTSSLFYNLICSNIQIGILSKRFHSIKEVYGLNSKNATFLNDDEALKKFLKNKTIGYKNNIKKFNKLYTPFKKEKLYNLWK